MAENGISDSLPSNVSEGALDCCPDDDTCTQLTDPQFWSKMFAASNQQPCASTSRLDSEWGYVLQKKEKSKKRRMDVGSTSSAVNSSSDLSEALSAISAALSLSSSGSSGEREVRKETMEDIIDWDALLPSNQNRNEIQAESSFGAEELTREDIIDRDALLPSNHNTNEIQAESCFGAEEQTREDNLLVPAEGMVFSSEEEVYKFYETYARETGFSVRKAKVQRRCDGTITKRYFFCSREGWKQPKKNAKYQRKETRKGCVARIACIVENGNWKISQFIEEHNHHLERLKNVEAREVHAESEAGMSTEAAATKSVEFHNLGMHVHDGKIKGVHLEEACQLMKYFSYLQEKDPSSFSKVQIDADGNMKNFFWTDGSSKIDYSYFGDVLILDTTFKMEKYNMICAPLFGLNHHRQYVLFGCALLVDESIDSFIWLFDTFVKAMRWYQPKTIFTNISPRMVDAIKEVFPQAKHQFGLWYIRRDAAECLSTYYVLPGFQDLFNQWVFGCQTQEEFESRRVLLLEKFNLHDNPWLNTLYMSREKWAPIFTKKTFSAGVQETASVDRIFQKLTMEAMDLPMFVSEYLKVAQDQHCQESYEDFLSKKKEPQIFSDSCLVEPQAAKTYTRTMFKMFQKELIKSFLLEIEEIAGSETTAKFKVTEEDRKESIVEFNCGDYSAACSCMKYESVGILCSHVLKVLRERKVSYIPRQYILRRWTKRAKIT